MFRLAQLLSLLLVSLILDASAPLYAGKVDSPGKLTIDDQGELFSSEARAQAAAEFEADSSNQGFLFAIFTFKDMPEAKREAFRQVNPKNRAELGGFFDTWAKELARANGNPTVAALLYHDGKAYYCRVISRSSIASDRGGGFSDDKAANVARRFATALEAAHREQAHSNRLHAMMDPALKESVLLVSTELKNVAAARDPQRPAVQRHDAEGRGLMSYLCIGLTIMLAVWLVIGLIRALTGGGAGGGGPGGGGFMSSLFGGLFGAMAGMWIYNSLFGSGASDLGAADSTAAAGDWGNADGYDNGASAGEGGGDWGDTGGDWGGGDFGGGDFGGGDW